MKKKAFTLIEMILVILLIAILMLLMLRMWWRYVWNMQFRNDKETFVWFFNKAVSQAMSSNYYNDQRYWAVKLSFEEWGEKLFLYALTGDEQDLIWSANIPVSSFSGIDWKADFTMQAYKIWCTYKDVLTEQSWWNIQFKLLSKYWEYNFCFKVDLGSCKLFESRCDERL